MAPARSVTLEELPALAAPRPRLAPVTRKAARVVLGVVVGAALFLIGFAGAHKAFGPCSSCAVVAQGRR